MSRGALGAVVTAAVVLLAGLAWWLLGSSGPAPPPGPVPPPRPAAAPGERESSAAAPGSGAPSAAEEPADAPPAAKGFPVAGRVLDAARSPVAGARIDAFPWDPAPRLKDTDAFIRAIFEERPRRAGTTSGADGSFSLVLPGPGRWVLIASAAGHSPGQSPDLHLREGAPTPSAEIVLGRACRLVVKVVDSEDGPVPGVEIATVSPPAQPDAFLGIPNLARTDAAGAAVFDGLPEGPVVVVARFPGSGRLQGRMLTLPGVEEVTFRVEGTASLLVRVRDAAGAPVEGASVSASLEFPGEDAGVLLTGRTGAEGTVQWDSLPDSNIEELTASKPGLAPAELHPGEDEGALAGPALLEKEIVLAPGAVVAGVVRRRPGDEPVPGARVTLLQPEAPDEARERSATSDAGGAFRFDGVPPGPGVLFALGEGLASPGLGALALRAGEGGPPDAGPQVAVPDGPAELRRDVLVEAAGRVTGRVVSAAGSPVAGAVARLRPVSGKDAVDQARFLPAPVPTDAEGRFEFPAVPAGLSWIVAATAPGHLPAEAAPIPVAAGAEATPVEIRLGEGGAIAGRITGRGGEPIPGARVSVSVRPRPPVPLPLSGTADAEGNFRVHPVPAGTASVSVEAEEFVSGSIGSLAVAAGAETRADLMLEPALAISGTVRDADGRPAAGIGLSGQLITSGRARGRRFHATTDGKGAFRIGGLAPGDYAITTAAGPHPSVTVRPVAAGTRDFTIDLPRGFRITGRVVDPAGAPLGKIKVVAQRQGDGGSHGATTTSSNGAFAIAGLLAGEYRVHASAPSGSHRETEQSGVPGGTEGVVLRMEPAFRIRGVVRGVDGTPSKSRPRVTAHDRTGNMVNSARADGTGAFELKGLADGVFTLRASGPDRQAGSVQASAGAEDVEIRLVGK